MEMFKIEYKPICSNCGKIINQQVKVVQDLRQIVPGFPCCIADPWRIEPPICPWCGCIFDKVVVNAPTIEEGESK